MNTLKVLIASIAVILSITGQSGQMAYGASAVNSETTTSQVNEYLKGWEAAIINDPTNQNLKNAGIMDFSVKRDGNTLIVTYDYRNLLDLTAMSTEEKEGMKEGMIQAIKSTLSDEEKGWHERGIVKFKFILVDKDGRHLAFEY
ncbi:MAG: hypothetical protein K2M56_08595 [Muribaculaceae bacterium]|nr:hypothetical protein [Muribaculaceae bacterium]